MDDLTIIGTVLQSVQACQPSFVFPSSVTGTNSGSENSYVFQDVREVVEEIIFEESSELVTLGSYTFFGCSKIRNVNLSNCKKLTKIGIRCFRSCSSLSILILPEDGVISELQEYSFAETNISFFHLPSTIRTCGKYIVYQCSSLDTITTVKDPLFTSLWTYAFSSSSLRHFVIPKTIKNMNGYSLASTNIESFEIDEENPYLDLYEGNIYSKVMRDLQAVAPQSTSINFHPNCTSVNYRSFTRSIINEVIFPSAIGSFCTYCFFKSKTKNVTIMNATMIPDFMFYSSLVSSLTLPSNVQTLGTYLLYGTSMTYLLVPRSVTVLDDAFVRCSNKLVVEFEEGSPFSFESGYLYNSNKTRLHAYMGTETSIEIIDSIEVIDGSVFNGKTAITSITFKGENVSEFGSRCFGSTTGLLQIDPLMYLDSYCYTGSGLTSVVVPGSVKIIQNYCFANCSNIRTVTIGEGTSTLQKYCFDNCQNLQTIHLPCSLISMQEFSFGNTRIKNVIFDSSVGSQQEVVSLAMGRSCFKSCSLESISLPSRLISIGESCFANCTLLAHVDVMDSQISALPPLAFNECTLLKSIYLSDTLSVIGDECFAGCGFEQFNIPASVSQLGSRALGNNKNLVTVSLDSNTHLSSIVSTSFSGCSKLREFVFDGKSLTSSSIDGVLFNEAAKVLCAYPPAHECGGKICDHYEVPASFTAIGPSAFLDSKLVSITMHSEVIEIGSRSFDSCNNLKRIVIEAPSINVGVLSFDGVKFSCGFFECNENVHQLLKDVEIPDIALSPCSTDYPSLLTLRYLMIGQNIVSSEE